MAALAASVALIGLVAPAAAIEPNDDFATATGPLTAGTTFAASLETTTDVDFQFFYVPDPTVITVTTINDAKARKDATDRGRTIASSLLQARKGKLPLPLAGTARTVAPGKRDSVKLTLVPGKYFVPVGRALPNAQPQPNVPFRLQIGPAGSTTDSFEIFARRCQDAQARVSRTKASKKNTAARLAKAKRRHRSDSEIRLLREKLRSKRAKVAEAQRLKRIVCSVPE